MLAHIKFDGFLYRNGIYQKISGFNGSLVASGNPSVHSNNGSWNFGSTSITMTSFSYNNGNTNGSKNSGILLTAKEAINMSGFSKISMKYSGARISHAERYIDVKLSISDTEYKSVRITSTTETSGTLSINIPTATGTTDRTVKIEMTAPYALYDANKPLFYGYCTVEEIKLE